MKWFEKKWFVNLRIRTRLSACFLFIAVVSVLFGAVGTLVLSAADSRGFLLVAAVAGGALILAVLLSMIVANINAFLIVDPTCKNIRLIERYSTGNYNIKGFLRDRDGVTLNYKDEIGECSRSLKGFRLYADNLAGCVRSVAEGNLAAEVPVCSPEDQLGNELRELVNNLHRLVASIVIATDKVSSEASLVSDSSLALSQGATQQASAIQELTASIEQIAAQTRTSVQNAEKANALVKSAKLNASAGNAHMRDMLSAMEDISISSGNINKIIKVIDDIAFQTNILALNAAVEAARAGQHGKGFAVVAEEVRNLAGKSANAAKETTELIESSIRKVEAGMAIADKTAKALDEIAAQVDSAADLVGSIAQASAGQAQGIGQINLGIGQVSQVIQTNAATAEESAAASEQLSSQASRLKEAVSIFRLRRSAGSGETSVSAGRPKGTATGQTARRIPPGGGNLANIEKSYFSGSISI